MSARIVQLSAAVSVAVLLSGGILSSQTPSTSSLTVLSKEGRRSLATSVSADQETVALDDLANMFQLNVREEALGALSVSFKGKTIILTPDQSLASVAGRLVSLPAPPSRVGRRWMVPLEFINRALGLIYDSRLELRKPSRLLLVGDVRVPRITLAYEPIAGGARLTVDATPRAASTVTQENDRLAIRFDADALDLANPPFQPPAQGLVQGVRAVDAVTLGVDVAPRFGGFKTQSQAVDNTTRLLIDILGAQAAEASPAGPSAAPASPAPAPGNPPDVSALVQPTASLRTIAIDPGHGGEDAGVRGANGTAEKDVTLAVARRAKAIIEGRLGIRVLLTREDDRTIPNDDRTALANSNKADVFISLHANASFRPSMTGASIYSAAFERDRDRASEAALAPERLPTFGGGLRNIELVPWRLAQIPHVERSTELARILEQQLRDRIPLAVRPIDSAPLQVLESANMPAVLVEMGFLSNPEQAKQLAGADFQTSFVQALFAAILKFRDMLDTAAGQAALEGGAR